MTSKSLLLVCALFVCVGRAGGGEFVLVEKGRAPLPVIISKDARPGTREAAVMLVEYVAKISGARLQIVDGTPQPLPERAVWIGVQPALRTLFPRTNFDFQYAEETLITANEHHLVIAGRDRWSGDQATEHGTSNAVLSFLEDQLAVRWLWPGPLGEDVPARERIAFAAPFEKRFHPPFRFRVLAPQQPAEWHRAQRLVDHSLRYQAGHGFTEWWEKYSAGHPEYFALLPNGTRKPLRSPQEVKLCISNPAVAAQWLANAERAFSTDPARVTMSASPNDGGGFCTCANCRALDHPDGAVVMGNVALTDRYVKFWNVLGRGLAQRFPGRDLWVGAYAYSAYRTPPIAEKLEPNIAIGYVGHFPMSSEEGRRVEKEQWVAWAKQARAMIYRPNLFHYSGGFIGLPTISLTSTIEDFRFLAEHQCIGVHVDTLPNCWATQGVQNYLMAQLAYDPLQDGEAVVRDYCERGFGAGGGEVRAYFAALESAHSAVLERIKLSSGWAREATEVFQAVYTKERWAGAELHLAKAEQQAAAGPAIHRERLDFLRNGFEGARLQIEILRAMKAVRDSGGKDTAAVARADQLCAERDTVFAKYKGQAIRRAKWYMESRQLADYLEAPSEAMRNGTYAPPRKKAKDAAKE